MKKMIMVFICGMIFSTAIYASIDKTTIEYKVAKELYFLKRQSKSAKSALERVQGNIIAYNSEANLDAVDKAKFPALNTLVTTTVTNLEAIDTYIEANWTDLNI